MQRSDAKPRREPSYCKHKGTGQARVVIDGKTFYLGKYGSAESKRKYNRLIGEWRANNEQIFSHDESITISSLILAYWKHAQAYYRKAGRQTSEVGTVQQALRPLRELYGTVPARQFGPLALEVVRNRMVEMGWCRSHVNKQVCRIRRAFRWAASKELIPGEVPHSLSTLSELRRGRTKAREAQPVKPVPEAHVNAIEFHVSAQVWAMVELQRLTGMRPGEVIQMRGCHIDASGGIWLYRPGSHKTEHHELPREVFIGPKAQAVLKPWLRLNTQELLFQPKEAEEARQAVRRQKRATPLYPSHLAVQAKKRKRKPRREPGDCYDVAAYRRAIARACEKAEVPAWHPHQLRHNAATVVRREYGVELARIILGHRSVAVTELYAEADREQAISAIAKIG